MNPGTTVIDGVCGCFDIDGTLLGDAAGLERLRAHWENCRRPGLLIYNSGRTVANQLELVASGRLPPPDYLIGSVGTEFAAVAGDARAAHACAIADERWDPAVVDAEVLGSLKAQPQAAEHCSRWKRSFTTDPAQQARFPDLLARLRRRGLRPKLIFSSDADLDLLHPLGGKGSALRRLLGVLGLPLSSCVVAGDSGNDRELLELPGVRSIVLPAQHQDLADLQPGPQRIRSLQPAAAGLLAALQSWEM